MQAKNECFDAIFISTDDNHFLTVKRFTAIGPLHISRLKLPVIGLFQISRLKLPVITNWSVYLLFQ